MEKNKENAFEIDSLIKTTYTKIATWHNEEANQTALKALTIELIEDIAGAAFDYLEIPFNISVLKEKNIDSEKGN